VVLIETPGFEILWNILIQRNIVRAIGTDTRQIEALPAEGDTLGISFPGVCAMWEDEPN
jgi:hypothetical protein